MIADIKKTAEQKMKKSLESLKIDLAKVRTGRAHAGILDHADAEELEEDLTANSSALMVAYENVWAGRFVAAINEADAVVIDQIRIPAHVVNAALSA